MVAAGYLAARTCKIRCWSGSPTTQVRPLSPSNIAWHRNIPTRRVRVEYDEAQVSVDQMKDVLQEEDYPVAQRRHGSGERPEGCKILGLRGRIDATA